MNNADLVDIDDMVDTIIMLDKVGKVNRLHMEGWVTGPKTQEQRTPLV